MVTLFLGSKGLNMSTWPDPQLSSYTHMQRNISAAQRQDGANEAAMFLTEPDDTILGSYCTSRGQGQPRKCLFLWRYYSAVPKVSLVVHKKNSGRPFLKSRCSNGVLE